MTGAIFMASGRVPKTSSIFLMAVVPRDCGHCLRICLQILFKSSFRVFFYKKYHSRFYRETPTS
jgi:hypothetical protein